MKRLRALKTAWERRRYGSSNAELVAAWSNWQGSAYEQVMDILDRANGETIPWNRRGINA